MRSLVKLFLAHHWLWIPPLAVVVALAVLSVTTLVAVIYWLGATLLGNSISAQHLDGFARLVSTFVAPALFFLLVFLFMRASRPHPARLGLVFGLLAAGVIQLLVILAGSYVSSAETALFMVLGLVSGYLGALSGIRRERAEDALQRAESAIRNASGPHDIVTAIADQLADAPVSSISIWQLLRAENAMPVDTTRNPNPQPGQILAHWPTGGGSLVPIETSLPVPAVPAGDYDGIPHELISGLRLREFERLGLRQATSGEGYLKARRTLVVSLTIREAGFSGVLIIASRKRWALSRNRANRYLTVASQAALALENQRLLRQASQHAESNERHRVAGEIHDTLAQNFAGIERSLQAVFYVPHADITIENSPARSLILGAIDTAQDSLKEARRIVWALDPGPLQDHSLHEAIPLVLAAWSTRSGIAATFSVRGTAHPYPSEQEVTTLRTMQEALTNTEKHASAHNVHVSLAYTDQHLRLTCTDDGVGFDPGSPSNTCPEEADSGYGLYHMHRRITRLGGKLSVGRRIEEGTEVQATVPYEPIFPPRSPLGPCDSDSPATTESSSGSPADQPRLIQDGR